MKSILVKKERTVGSQAVIPLILLRKSAIEGLSVNLLLLHQIFDKKHNVSQSDKECLILSLQMFKFVWIKDRTGDVRRAPRKNDVYSLDLKNIIPTGGVTCLVAKTTKDEAVLLATKIGAMYTSRII
ncbi:hypothetical protein Tco_1576135 [Tanacetum coccineum]